MKELYDDLKMEVVAFEAEDIIVTSGDYGEAGVGGAIDGGSPIN